MAEKIYLTIDEMQVEADPGNTILEVARANDIYIPTLCHHPHLTHFGACRLCIVEVSGTNRLLTSCTTPVSEGMDVKTNTPRLAGIRKTLIELLLLHHPLDCLTCDKGGECELQNLAFNLQVTENSLGVESPAGYSLDNTNFLIQRDLRKCMLCGKCVRVCDEIRNIGALGFSHHGIVTTIGYPEKQLSNCEFCGQCLSVCPVGALSSKSAFEARPWELEAVASVCPYCGCGCSFYLQHKENKIIKVTSSEDLGANQGLLCVKGRFGYDFIHHPSRITSPLIKKDGVFVQASWEEALQYIAKKFKSVLAEKGSKAIAGVASSRCTNEENYLFQKFMRGVLGTNNIDNFARLEQASSMIALGNTLGYPAATNSIAEVKEAQSILVIGANPTSSHVVMGLSIKQAVRNFGSNLILVDPGKTKLTPFAKSWLRIKPGTDLALLNGLAHVIIAEGLQNKEYVAQHTNGYSVLERKVAAYSPERVAQICGIEAEDIKNAARMFAKAESACIVYGSGITQQNQGVDNVYALLNILLLTGNLGRSGTGMHPLRTSCNVQGACDMGALPDYLPGYQPVDDDGTRQKFEAAWGVKLPDDPGLTLIEMINAADDGKLGAMYVMGEDLLKILPKKEQVQSALGKLDFLVVQDLFLTETAQLADVVLPTASFAEKNGTFTSGERRVQKINAAIKSLGQSRPDGEILQAVAEAMGSSLKYSTPAKVMEEISQLVPIYAGIRYQHLGTKGLQWPLNAEGKGTEYLTDFPAHIMFNATDYIPQEEEAEYPYILLTGGELFHHLSGTMTTKTKSLSVISPDAALEMNAYDAQKIKAKDGDKVVLTNKRGSLDVKIKVTDRFPAGVVFLPQHYSSIPVNLMTDSKISNLAKTPASKNTRVSINLLG